MSGHVRKSSYRPPDYEERRRKARRAYLRLGATVLGLAALVALAVGAVRMVKQLPVWKSQDKEAAAPAFLADQEETSPFAVEEEIAFAPHCVDATKPSNYILSTEIEVEGKQLASVSDYRPRAEISFETGSRYTQIDGIAGFRGNNFRSSPAYGFANMSQYKLKNLWTSQTGSLSYGEDSWSGSGWTGQPLIVRWPASTKAVMNLYDWAKEEEDLVEVIYACMDGYIYFLDLKTGKATRDALYLGFTFKGAGALDPRGYPILYLGSGYNSYNGTSRAFIISLIDCQVLYTFGNDDPFSLRGSLSFFDASALVDAETDTLIYPGESGILYLIHLNTEYEETAGTLTIQPDNIVKWRYNTTRSSLESFWLGMEDSPAIYKGYLFIADNGGNLMCLDLNTLQLVWVQDILDDSNGTPVLSLEGGHLYLYISTSFHLGWRSQTTAEVPIWKINAETGEIVWRTPYTCYSASGVSGGVQSTIASGRGDLSDYVYVTVARTGSDFDGVLACLNRYTGQVVWEHKAYYAWSSPVCVYNEDGSGKVIYCTCGGKMYLLDGKTGEVHDSYNFGEDDNVEASPAVYQNYLVVGTRDCKIGGFLLQ